MKFNPLPYFTVFFFGLLLSCQPEPRNEVPADETHIYSGTFRAIQDPFIEVAGERYKNEFGEAPIQITAEVQNEQLVFTIYGRDYGIYDVNLFVGFNPSFNGIPFGRPLALSYPRTTRQVSILLLVEYLSEVTACVLSTPRNEEFQSFF